jgi:adenylosuccinate lyase
LYPPAFRGYNTAAMNDPHDVYASPLIGRYASEPMSRLWSERTKILTWRRLWIALAESQRELGLEISEEQLRQMRDAAETIDFAAAAEYEARFRHDVMAHVHAFGDVAPLARPILHLGATSQYVGCNGDLIRLLQGLEILRRRLAVVIDALGRFAAEHAALPTLGFTHFQPAQPTTVGKRATLWCWEFCMDLAELEHRCEVLAFRGAKGTTGTQASYLALFDGDHEKVRRLDAAVAEKMGFSRVYPVTGQTYSRKVDAQVLSALAGVGASVQKLCNDVRLLANRKELEEPFAKSQIGSSAMAYKRNPMRCERATGLARFLIDLAPNALHTAAEQWLERTLDDSANRRLSIPEAFLAADACLGIVANVVRGLVVYPAVIAANLAAELPFMATENLLMAAVRAGGDRQELHERIRLHSQAAAEQIKLRGQPNDLLDRLAGDEAFAAVDVRALAEPSAFVGRAPEQVEEFLAGEVEPVRRRYAGQMDSGVEDLKV